jgi:hypothetical protein
VLTVLIHQTEFASAVRLSFVCTQRRIRAEVEHLRPIATSRLVGTDYVGLIRLDRGYVDDTVPEQTSPPSVYTTVELAELVPIQGVLR